MLPFSFEDPLGWKRSNGEAADGSLSTITWKGELAEDGLARFAFLASTPEPDGEIAWKAIQSYDDGHTTRWIGAPDSENPAAVTKISESAPRENAGGESAQPAAATTPGATATGDDPSPLPIILSAAALAITMRGRPRPALAPSADEGRW